MAKNIRSEDFKLEGVRASFAYLLRPRKVTKDDGSVRLEFQCSFLWPKANDPLMGKSSSGQALNIGEVCAKIAVEHWGEKAAQWIRDGLIRNPFLDGDGPQGVNKKTGERYPGYAGNKFIRTSSKEDRPPQVFDDKLGADNKLVKVTDPNRIYAGCYVNAVVNAFTWENDKGGKGISFGLNMVQFARDGEKIGGVGGANPNDFFAGVPDSAKAAAASAAASGAGAGGLFA